MTRRIRATLVGGALTMLGACAPSGTATVLERPPATTADLRPATAAPRPATTTTAVAPAPTTSIAAPPSADAATTLSADTTATWEASHLCLAAPERCDVGAIAVAGSPAAVQLQARLDELVREHLRVVPGSGPLQLVVESAEITGDEVAVVVACVTDGMLLVDVADPTDPLDDVIFDDSLGSYRWRWGMQHEATGWRRRTVEQLGYYPGVARCPA
jgi:hypothetical protein